MCIDFRKLRKYVQIFFCRIYNNKMAVYILYLAYDLMRRTNVSLDVGMQNTVWS
jgi:hypothetical protein